MQQRNNAQCEVSYKAQNSEYEAGQGSEVRGAWSNI